MGVRLWTVFLGGVLVIATACGGSCPKSTVVAVPPFRENQKAFKLPLGEDGRNRAIAYFVGCEGDDCDEPDSDQHCALKALYDSGIYREKLLECSGAVEVQIYDAREPRPLKGVSLGGLVYVYYRKGVPPDYGDSPEILIFSEYVPEPAE